MKTLCLTALLATVAGPAYASTVTGTLHSVCNYAPVVGGSCKPSIEVNGVSYFIQTGKFFTNGELVPLNGATVKLTGKAYGPIGAPGAQFLPTFTPSSGKISVKGQLNALYFEAPVAGIQGTIPTFPHTGNMMLEWKDNGVQKSIIVDTGNQNFLKYNEKTVWVTGTVQKGGGDMAPYFTATLVNGHKGAFMATPGTNVALGSSTLPTAATETKTDAAAGNVGVTR